MTWITPKTDWTPNDYYNLEDAQRIAGNICHLRDMARSIYGNHLITCFTIRYAASDKTVYFCGRSSISPYSISVAQPSEYSLGMTSWLDLDAKNFDALAELIMLSKEPEPTTHSGYYISDNYNIRYPEGPYWTCNNEDSIVNVKDYLGHTGVIDFVDSPFTAIWGNTFAISLPVNAYWYHHPVARRPGYTGDDLEQCDTMSHASAWRLYNEQFYTSVVLNHLESKILEVYNLLSSY